MNGVVAVRAVGLERVGVVHGPGEGQAMAGNAGCGLARLEQGVRARSMGRVTVSAVFAGGGMLVDPGARDFLMAIRAHPGFGSERLSAILVCVMAVGAIQHAFAQRVMGGQVELSRDFGVAAHAHAGHISSVSKELGLNVWRLSHVPGLAIVGVVAVAAEHPRSRVLRARPTEERLAPHLMAFRAIFTARKTDVARTG